MLEEKVNEYSASDRIYFYRGSRRLPYNEANEHCENFHGGSLAILDNENSFQDVFDGFKLSNWPISFYYRVGLSKQNGLFKWIDGSSTQIVKFCMGERFCSLDLTSVEIT